MAADLLTLKYRDAFGAEGSFSIHIQAGLAPSNADLLAAIQAHRNLSQAQLVSAKLVADIDISGLANPAAVATGSYDRVRDQAVLQARRVDGTGVVRCSVPAPVDAVFESTGAYAQQDVDGDGALVQAFRNAILDEQTSVTAGEIWTSPQEDDLDFDKGWRKGQPHS